MNNSKGNEVEKQMASSEVAPEITNSFEVRQEITNFSNDDAGIIQPTPGEKVMPKIGTMQFTDGRTHDVISYLQRPQLVRQFAYPCASERSSIISGGPIKVPEILFSDLVKNKLDGFTSFRATAVFKLQVNAQPFQAGRLMLFAVPMPDLVNPRQDWVSKHVTMAQALHNVQMDIAQQTEVELRVPFISPFNSYDLINGNYSWAEMYVMVYSKLCQVGGDDLECLLWAHFEDIELGAPTSGKMKAVQQSGKVAKGAPKQPSAAAAASVRTKEAGGDLLTDVSAGAVSGWSRIGETLPFVKPVTDIFGGLAGAAGSFLKPFSGILGGIGKIFGLSKPVLGHSGNTVVIRPSQYFGNVDGIDHSHVLALSALNCIDEYPDLGGTDLSETSLEFLKTIPQFVKAFNYGMTNSYNDELCSILVTPTTRVPATVMFEPGMNITEFQSFQPTILNYITSPFAYWTGSLVYTFRFVKTHYHSGRVEISFHPFVTKVDTSRMEYVYRLVIDLRENSEVSVSIPYISPTPWKRIDTTIDPVNEKRDYSVIGSSCVGVVYCRALTPLYVGSNIASNTVECVVECRAGEDFSIQAPVHSPYVPFRFASTVDEEVALMKKQRVVQQAGNVYALPGTLETRTTAIMGKTPVSITGMESDVLQPSTEQFCAGEIFQDYRALTRRFAYVEMFEPIDSTYATVRNAIEYVRPPEITTLKADKDMIYNFKLFYLPSPLSFVASMYTFYRGSLRLKIYSPDGLDLTSIQLFYRPEVNYEQETQLKAFNYIGPAHYEQPMQKKFAEFQIPYYSPTIITVPYPEEDIDKIVTQPIVSAVIGSVKPNGMAAQSYYVASAAGDDMSFHMFVGVPPVLGSELITSKYTYDNGSTKKDISLFQTMEMQANPCQFVTGLGAQNENATQYHPSLFRIDIAKFSDTANDKTPPGCASSLK